MNDTLKNIALFGVVAVLIAITGFTQSWNAALLIVNLGLISSIMAIGVNLQWGFAGLFNVGIMGFVALGGLGAVLVSMPPTTEAWAAGGGGVVLGLLLGAATVIGAIMVMKRMQPGRIRTVTLLAVLIVGFYIFRSVFDPAVLAVEKVNPAVTGYLGGAGLNILVAWPVGGLLAAGVAWLIGKTALGLRSDYLAIATLGIAEIIIAVLKNEDWLSRGVKNVIGIPRPLPYEIDLQKDAGFDEAHLLFDDAPKALVDKVEQVARLIRSKGVGIYFITQSPDDIPEDILGQLGNRVQHALRAFTARDRKNLRMAAETYRENPRFSTEEAIREVGVGEAVTSMLMKKGIPGVVERTLIRPPSSQLGPISKSERQAIMAASDMSGKYDKTIDRKSAYEILARRAQAAALEAEVSEVAAQEQPAMAREFNAARRYSGSRVPSWPRMSSGISSGLWVMK